MKKTGWMICFLFALLMLAGSAQAGSAVKSGATETLGCVIVTVKSGTRLCPGCGKELRFAISAMGTDAENDQLYVRFRFSCDKGCKISDDVWRGRCRSGVRAANQFSGQCIYANSSTFYVDITYAGHQGGCGHSYMTMQAPSTCGVEGCTMKTCILCGDSTVSAREAANSHWFSEWMPNGDGTHSAHCLRKRCTAESTVPCTMTEAALEGGAVSVCPVCGEVSTGEYLEWMDCEWENRGYYPVYGELTVRRGVLATGEQLMTATFEIGGKIRPAKSAVRLTMADISTTMLLLDGESEEKELSVTRREGKAIFDLAPGEVHVVVLDAVKVYKTVQPTIF